MDAKSRPRFMVAAIFLCLFLQVSVSYGADTIFINQSLSGDQTIVSADEVFELGFFTPGNSSNYYIGIWYKELFPRTIVWVANRDRPVSDRFSSVLRISSGNLVLLNESRAPIWSINMNLITSSAVQAVLLNRGNLVLIEGSNLSTPLWQSFDYPTDTILPGGKLGFNKKTKRSSFLTSWKNSEDPAPGYYSLELSSNGTKMYLVLRHRSSSEIYWSSEEFFSFVPEKGLNYLYNFSHVSNDNETYLTYDVYNSSIISRFMIDISGQIKQMNWLPLAQKWNLFWLQPKQECAVYGFCGAYGVCNGNNFPFCSCLIGFEAKLPRDRSLKDYSGGCQRKTELQCGDNGLANGDKDRFTKIPSMVLSGYKNSLQIRNIAACESTCLGDCSCTAYAYDNSSSCLIWSGDLLNLKQVTADDRKGETLYIRLAASEFPSSKKIVSVKKIITYVSSAAAFAVVLGLIVFVILRRRKKIVGMGKAVDDSLVVFEYRYLQNATKNFSKKLGGGGFGSVFKGTLPDSTVIAVKQLESISQGEKQFRAEVSTIGIIQHVNLVRLRGFCSRGTKKLLVYDYMPNGSLDSHLFETKNLKVLNWETRYKIALGTARGLYYLHEKCRECIIHCDIKPDNVLLDAEFCPKLADFGLAKLVGRDFSRVLTTIRGTRGYLAPEWISGLPITAKADVYSFGMLLFEIISGRRNSKYYVEDEVSFFPIFVATVIIEGGDVVSLLDPRLEGKVDAEELIRVCRLACWCIQYEETQRPSMGQIVQILEGLTNVNLPPLPRLFQATVGNPDEIIFPTESCSRLESSRAGNSMSTATSSVKSTESSLLLKS